MPPSARPARWMPTQVENPRRQKAPPASLPVHQPSPAEKTKIFPSRVPALPHVSGRGVAHTRSAHCATARVGTGHPLSRGVSPTATPKVCGCGVLPGAGGGRRVLGCSCTPRQEPRGVQEHAQIKGRI